jgi:hypothetical protein
MTTGNKSPNEIVLAVEEWFDSVEAADLRASLEPTKEQLETVKSFMEDKEKSKRLFNWGVVLGTTQQQLPKDHPTNLANIEILPASQVITLMQNDQHQRAKSTITSTQDRNAKPISVKNTAGSGWMLAQKCGVNQWSCIRRVALLATSLLLLFILGQLVLPFGSRLLIGIGMTILALPMNEAD